jgi:hypothetical protein
MKVHVLMLKKGGQFHPFMAFERKDSAEAYAKFKEYPSGHWYVETLEYFKGKF